MPELKTRDWRVSAITAVGAFDELTRAIRIRAKNPRWNR